MSVRTNRRRAREVAMQSLYLLDQNPDADAVAVFDFVAEHLKEKPLIDFAKQLIEGVQSHLEDIDVLLGQTASNWSIGRMAPVDRNILRLAIYEMEYEPQTPPKVAITEALEIAKRFSTSDAPRFINGILDRVVNRQRFAAIRNAAQTPTEPAPTPSTTDHPSDSPE